MRSRPWKALIAGTLTSMSVLANDWSAEWSNTWGYSMMSPEEIRQFEADVRKLKTVDECNALLKEHNTIIQQRIDDWVITPKRADPVDTCGQLRASGQIQ